VAVFSCERSSSTLRNARSRRIAAAKHLIVPSVCHCFERQRILSSVLCCKQGLLYQIFQQLSDRCRSSAVKTEATLAPRIYHHQISHISMSESKAALRQPALIKSSAAARVPRVAVADFGDEIIDFSLFGQPRNSRAVWRSGFDPVLINLSSRLRRLSLSRSPFSPTVRLNPPRILFSPVRGWI